ncbi:GNAT family N-acetyltransferase [Nocardiopsis sp. NPDC057823]|uniref:GNAT family N-acetyltransferase n=1 Tax=Nocardiopsis sp. NPDC057823 TaxID=3346256 RepID=UPI00366E5E92
MRVQHSSPGRPDSDGITVRDLTTAAEWSAASGLYRSVFGYEGPEHAVSPRLLAALRENGGSVLGAFDENGSLVGFCYGVHAVDGGAPYHYSQTAVVAPTVQGRGVGRALKRGQAEAARRTGVDTMRWAFDPYSLRNAHFNLEVLGAVGIRFLPDFYDDGGSDRVIVSWSLGSAAGRPRAEGPGHRTTVTAPAGPRTAAEDPGDRARLSAELRARFTEGLRLVSVARPENAPDTVVYTFSRGET